MIHLSNKIFIHTASTINVSVTTANDSTVPNERSSAILIRTVNPERGKLAGYKKKCRKKHARRPPQSACACGVASRRGETAGGGMQRSHWPRAGEAGCHAPASTQRALPAAVSVRLPSAPGLPHLPCLARPRVKKTLPQLN